MADTINVQPSQLNTTSQVANNGSSTTTNLSQDVDSALADLVNALVAVDLLQGVAADLESFGQSMLATLACFATGLTVVSSGLVIASQAFKGLDASLAATLAAVEKQLPYYTGYETHGISMPVIHVPASGFSLSATVITIHPHSQSSFWGGVGNFFSTAWHDTTSAVGNAASFVGGHWQYFAAGAAITVLVVGGVLLTIPSGGTSDAGAAAGTSALLTWAAAGAAA
jgi:hypothetical protein